MCNCGSNRILSVSGKTSDLCFVTYSGLDHTGYVPLINCIGGGDYLEFSACMDCGKLQGVFPVPDENIKGALGD